jgi:regulator of sigma E protease
MEIVVMIAQLLLGLSILVGVHELGHFMTAKWFKMRVEQFALGLPPQMFGLKFLPSKIFSITRGETEYLLSPLPLGGYVKIAGMMDESMDTEQMASEPKPYEFRSKPAWQRLIVMMGGIVVNVITGIVIFGMLLFIYGEEYLPAKEVKYGIAAGEIARQIGLQSGDKIVEINGQPFTNFGEVYSSTVLLGSGSSYTVERDGKQINVPIPDKILDQISDKKSQNSDTFITPRYTFSVDTVLPPPQPGFFKRLFGGDVEVKETPAQRIGLKSGDKIVKINDTPIRFFDELKSALNANKGKQVNITINRNGVDRQASVLLDSTGSLGFVARRDEFKRATINYSFGEAFAKAPGRAFGVISDQLKAFGKIFRRELSPTNSLGSFVSIGKLYGGTWDWERFWTLTAVLSMVLAFMNFLPIPVLDGGHVVFLLYEMVAGRAPSQKFMEVALRFGMVILFGLMALAIGLDFYRLVR